MTTYVSTFASGLQEIVAQALPRQLADAAVRHLMDGMVIYDSDRPLPQVTGIPFFNNTFILIHYFPSLPDGGLQFMMQAILKKPDLVRVPRWALKKAAAFRLMASRANQTVAIPRDLLERLERFFSHRLAIPTNRSRADVELWFIERSEGCGLLGLRVTRTAPAAKHLQPGELRPELAHLLCLLSEPAKTDAFLDPFAGSGALPRARAQGFPYRQITALDADPAIADRLRQRLPKDARITCGSGDALHLAHIADGSISKIVTDPPWGLFEARRLSELVDFYSAMLAEFTRVLQPGGLLVVLMGQKERFEAALAGHPQLALAGKWDILVSGKKAAIYKIEKTGAEEPPAG
jgi:predicted RNA methylase